jgi:hypothetical protein
MEHFGWHVFGVISFGTVMNRMDRTTADFVKPDVRRDIRFSDFRFGVFVAFFRFT